MSKSRPSNWPSEGRSARVPRAALAAYFTRLGLTAFGGPLSHVAMMEEGIVRRRGWVTPAEFTEGLALCQMLPGPVSTQLGIYIGYLRGGPVGAVLAGLGFILPAYLILLALSALYWRYGTLPTVGAAFYGLNPAVIALILAAAWRLARASARRATAAGLVLGAFAARAVLGVNEIVILLGAGFAGAVLPIFAGPSAPSGPAREPAGGGDGARGGGDAGGRAGAMAALAAPAAAGAAAFLPLAVLFFKIGALVIGGGYVIVPMMESQVVDRLGWMSRGEFLDGVALGQVTPGPILITAAFVGYRVAGVAGSAVATAAIFLPSFLWILAFAPQLPRLRRWRRMRGFLEAANPAAVGTILASAWSLGRASIVDGPTAVIAAASLVLVLRARVDPALLLAAAAAAGILLR